MNSGDCRTKLFKNILKDDFGIDLPEYIIFGLGCGLDSSIIRVPLNENSYIYGIVGRIDNAEINFCEMTGIKYEIRKTLIPESKLLLCDDIVKNLHEGKKVFAYVDRYYLNYLPFDRAHFGWHIVQVVDYYANTNNVLLNDSVVSGSQIISVEHFNCAHYADIIYAQPEGKEIILSLKRVGQIAREQYRFSLYKQACCMLSKNGGLVQLKQFLEKLVFARKKARYLKGAASYIKLQLKFLSKTVREQEISGSFYRVLFRNYLMFCLEHDYVESEIYKVIIMLDTEILLWKAIAIMEDEYIVANWQKAYDECIDKLHQICNLEENIFTLIQSLN